MPDELTQRSVFVPVQQADLSSGPFSQYLQPQPVAPPQPVVAGGGISRLGAAAALVDKFFQGAAQGKIRSYALQQSENIRKVNALQSFVQQVMMDPDVTDEAKTLARQQFFRAIGAEGQKTLAESPGGKGGKGGGKSEGLGGHVKNALGQLFEGMSGGKLPKGTPDVGDTLIQLQNAIYGKDGQPIQKFSREQAYQGAYGQYQQALKGLKPDASLEDASKATSDPLAKMAQYYPDRARFLASQLQSGYQAAPAPGSVEAMRLQLPRILESAGAPGTPLAKIPAEAASIVYDKRLGLVNPEEQLVYTDPNTKKKVEVQGALITLPGRPPWYYSGDTALPVDPSQVRKGTTAEQRLSRSVIPNVSGMPPGQQAIGMLNEEGKWEPITDAKGHAVTQYKSEPIDRKSQRLVDAEKDFRNRMDQEYTRYQAQLADIQKRQDANANNPLTGITPAQAKQEREQAAAANKARAQYFEAMHENIKRLIDPESGLQPVPVPRTITRRMADVNNNPGNIRGADGEFKHYNSPQEGWDALRAEIQAKISGNNRHNLNAESTIAEFAAVYSPEQDGNVPKDVAEHIANYLHVTPDTPIGRFADQLDLFAKAVAYGSEGATLPFMAAQPAPARTPAGPSKATTPGANSSQPFSKRVVTGADFLR